VPRLRVLMLVLLAHAAPAAHALAPMAAPSAAEGRVPLNAAMGELRDAAGAMTLADARAARFAPVPAAGANHGFTADVYWYRAAVRNPAAEPGRWLLEFAYPLLDRIDLHVVRADGRVEAVATGDRRARAPGQLFYRNVVLPLELGAGESAELYARVESESTFLVSMVLWEPEVFAHQARTETLWFGLFGGVMLAMALYNFFIMLTVRDVAYVWYIAYIATVTLLQLDIYGLTQLYLPELPAAWSRISVPVLVTAGAASSVLFSQALLQTLAHTPAVHRMLNLLLVALAACLALAVFSPYRASMPPVTIAAALTSLALVVAGCAALVRGVRVARYYLLAWSVYLVAVVLRVLEANGLLPSSFITDYGHPIGSGAVVTLLSLALGDRINSERKAKIAAQAEVLVAREAAITHLKRYQGMVENLLEGVFQAGPDGRFESANPALAQMLGYASPDALRVAVADLRADLPLREEDAAAITRALREEGQVAGYELPLRRADGGTLWGVLSARAIRGEDGAVRYYDGVLADVSARREREQLAREREVARAAAAAKSEFLAKMSHELRTPMNAIVGFTDLALRTTSHASRLEHLKQIDSASHSLLGIINDILDLSKIEAGKLTLSVQDFALQPLLDKLSDLFHQAAADKGIELVIAPAAGLPPLVAGDPLRLEQVLVNLVSNAVKFTQRGEVEVRLRALAGDGRSLTLEGTVRDTGIGIPRDQLPRLFTPFTQAGPDVAHRYGGTGLGLAIAKQLVELMQGRIEAESTPGQGSEFRFTVTVGVVAGARRARPAAPVAGARVLLVDDNASARQVYGEMLGHLGMSATAVASAEEALTLLVPGRFDAVLMDWRMPALDGVEATRRIRADARHSGLPVILMTAHGREDLVDSASVGGVAARVYCLGKPIKPALLLETLTQALDRPAAAEAVRPRIAESAAAQKLRGLRVLLAEDNALNRKLALEILREAGVQADSVENGRDAVAAARRERYDAVLMDLRMPLMDGLAAARAIRGDPACADLPIIAMTANAMEHDRQASLAAGMNDFLAKPIEMPRLLETLLRWTRGARPAAGAPAPGAGGDSGAALAGLQELETLIVRRDYAAARRFRDLEPVLRSAAAAGGVDALGRALLDFEYERSLRELRELRAALGAGERP
jgi:PAS domain S-box-containing protein